MLIEWAWDEDFVPFSLWIVFFFIKFILWNLISNYLFNKYDKFKYKKFDNLILTEHSTLLALVSILKKFRFGIEFCIKNIFKRQCCKYFNGKKLILKLWKISIKKFIYELKYLCIVSPNIIYAVSVAKEKKKKCALARLHIWVLQLWRKTINLVYHNEMKIV